LLKFETCDMRDEMRDITVDKRRKCADVWAKRAPWLTTLSNTRQEQPVQHHFEWGYYFDFTFMIDAVSFEEGIRSAPRKKQKVFKAIHKVHAPQLQKKKKGIATTSTMMFYTVMHRHGGIIAGPALCYSGSIVPKSQASQKADILWHLGVTLHSIIYDAKHFYTVC